MAGFFGFSDYDKPGPGVQKGEPQSHGVIRYFVVYGRKFWNLALLNLIYFLCSLPAIAIYTFLILFFWGAQIAKLFDPVSANSVLAVFLYSASALLVAAFGTGPATAGMTYVLKNYSVEEHAWVWDDFKDNFKSNFKQSFIVFLVDLGVITLSYIDFFFYAQKSIVLLFVLVFLIIIYLVMHQYIYVLIVSYKLSLKQLYKYSFALSMIKFPRNLLVFVLGFIPILFVSAMLFSKISPIAILLVPTLFFVTPSLMWTMNAYSVIKKYMNRGKEE